MTEWDWEYDAPIVNSHWCNHEWIAVVLIISVVFDCKKCGAKKEECE